LILTQTAGRKRLTPALEVKFFFHF
jgi:hypothetical protein